MNKLLTLLLVAVVAALLALFVRLASQSIDGGPEPSHRPKFPLTSIVRRLVSPQDNAQVIEIHRNAHFISPALAREWAYYIRLSDGRTIWVAESELRPAPEGSK